MNKQEFELGLEEILSVDVEDRNFVAEMLKKGGLVTVVVASNYQVLLSVRMHARVAEENGLSDSQILLEGYAGIKDRKIFLEVGIHHKSDGPRLEEAIEKKLNQTLPRMLNLNI